MKARDYWNANLDTDNLSRRSGAAHPDIGQAAAFASTPEFEWLRGRLRLQRAGAAEPGLLIDIGGGVGMHAILWAREGMQVVVVDPATDRLKALRELARQAGVADSILFVAGCAESLPVRDGSADACFTKAVLIHTDLSVAARDIHRVLRPGGQGLFIEPLNRNPLIRLYRSWFAPRIWRSITRYFDQSAIDELRAPFERLRWKPFYLVSAGSFVWQYGLKRPAFFRRSLRRWMRLDAWLLRKFEGLELWCWFAAMEVRKSR